MKITNDFSQIALRARKYYLQIVFNFIFERLGPNRITIFACPSWVTSLYNKSFNIAMEQTSVIIVTGAKC